MNAWICRIFAHLLFGRNGDRELLNAVLKVKAKRAEKERLGS